jgi:hypothetical protein
MGFFLYQSKSGKRIGLQAVKMRPTTAAGKRVTAHAEAVAALRDAEQALAALPENASKVTRTKAENAVAAAREAVSKAATRAKAPYKFLPAEGDTLARYNLSDEKFAAWRTEPDPEKRAAILADIEPVETASPVHPNVAAHAGYMRVIRELTPDGTPSAQFALDSLASGTLIFPTTGSGASQKSERKSAEERAYDAAVEMFGAIEEDEDESATADADAETPES